MIIAQYPALRRVALEIAYDNGMINRLQTEDQWLASLDGVLECDGCYAEDLEAWSSYLDTLSSRQIALIAAGEQDDPEKVALLAAAPLPPSGADGTLDGLLDDIFEAPI